MKEFYKSQYPMKDFLLSVKEVHWTNGPIMVNQQDKQLHHMQVFDRMNQWQMMTSDNFLISLSHVMIIHNGFIYDVCNANGTRIENCWEWRNAKVLWYQRLKE